MGVLQEDKDTAVVDIWTVQTEDEEKDMELTKDLEYWMTNLPDELRKVSIIYLAIPGSHNSFTNGIDSTSEVSPDAEEILQILKMFGRITQAIMAPWARCQHYNATLQLNSGIRYFDLRISTRENDDKLYFVHSQFADTIVPILTDIKDFLDTHPQEVIILDCQHFYGFSSETHDHLIDIMLSLFGDKLLPYTQYMEHLNLNYLTRDYNYQVLLIYRHNAARQQRTLPTHHSHSPIASISNGSTPLNNSRGGAEFLWPAACYPTPWPDTMSADTLIHKLTANLEQRNPSYGYVSQFVLTPKPSTILGHLCSSLESVCSARLEKRKSIWISRQVAGRGGVNVIISDFIEMTASQFCRDVVSLNAKLLPEHILDVKNNGTPMPPVDG